MLRKPGKVREMFGSDVPVELFCSFGTHKLHITRVWSNNRCQFPSFSRPCCRLHYSWRNQLAAKIIFRKPEVFGGGGAKFAGALLGVPRSCHVVFCSLSKLFWVRLLIIANRECETWNTCRHESCLLARTLAYFFRKRKTNNHFQFSCFFWNFVRQIQL